MDAECPQCGEELQADDTLVGQKVKCPSCNHDFVLSSPQAGILPAMQSTLPALPLSKSQSPLGNIKICPFCSEQILATAHKCKHCGEFLNPAMRTAMAKPLPNAPQLVRTAKSRGIYIILGLFLGGLFGVHNFYAGRYSSAFVQLLIMFFLGWIVIGIVINTIWVLIELFAVTTDGNGNPMS